MFWLLLILLNNLRNIFIFCINVEFDEMLLLDKNEGIEIDSLRVFPFLSHLLVAGCDIGVRFSVRPSVRPSTFMSTFDIYVKVSILINYKTKQPSNLA